MNDFQWYDYWRLFNVLFGGVLLVLVARSARKSWKTYTDKAKDYVIVVIGFAFIVVEGGLEAVYGNAPYRTTIFFTTLLLVWMMKALSSKESLTKE